MYLNKLESDVFKAAKKLQDTNERIKLLKKFQNKNCGKLQT